MFGMGYGWGNGFISIIGMFVCGVLAILAFAVAVGLVFLLVRFLLVATRAAQLYVAEHEPPRPAVPSAPTAPPAPTGPTTPAEPTPAAPAAPASAAAASAATTAAAGTASTKPPAKAATAKMEKKPRTSPKA